jgi:hypothetical protein
LWGSPVLSRIGVSDPISALALVTAVTNAAGVATAAVMANATARYKAVFS